MTIQKQSKDQRLATLDRTLSAFDHFCRIEFQFDAYAYEREISYWCLYSLLVEPIDIFIKIARQAGKTETVTLLLRFLLIFYVLLTGQPLMTGLASPKGEQAKTSIDRIKKSIALLRDRWQVEDREFNAATVRSYRFDKLTAEIFKFSLAPTTSNESKTLNLLIVDEAHLADDAKRSNELDPMLASTGGVTWHIGVGCSRVCDFKKGCDGELPDSQAIVVPVDRVIADRRKKYEETGDPRHLEYENAFARELRKKGRENPEIRRNFYLEDTVEEGNFISRERLLSCARGKDEKVSSERLFVGIDWARESDFTWLTVVNDKNDVIDWFKYPHGPYLTQIELMNADLERKGYLPRILAVRGDDTGSGGPMELLMHHGKLAVSQESFFKFTLQSKNTLYLNFEQALFKEPDDAFRFSYPADHPLASEFEEEMGKLVREYKGDGEYLSVHHPAEQGAHDDAPDSTALALLSAHQGAIGEILFG